MIIAAAQAALGVGRDCHGADGSDVTAKSTQFSLRGYVLESHRCVVAAGEDQAAAGRDVDGMDGDASSIETSDLLALVEIPHQDSAIAAT